MIRVIFDTNFYFCQKYYWESQKFKVIKRLCIAGYLKIYIPEIVDREIKSHLLSIGKEAYVRLKKVMKDYPSLLPTVHEDIKAVFKSLKMCKTDNESDNCLIKDYEEFKQHVSAEIIPNNYATTKTVVDKYFNAAPPFEKKKDKRCEFPDALALESIKSFFSENFEVVSEDKGWKLSLQEVENCTMHTSDSLFFARMEDIFAEGERQKQAREFIGNNIEVLTNHIKDIFPDRGFMATDSWDEYAYDPEVSDVHIQDIIIEEISDGKVAFSASVQIYYTITVDYDDPDSWTKDSDTKEIFYRHRVEGARLSREFAADGNFTFNMAGNDFYFSGMSQCDIDIPDIVDFEIDEHDYHH